METLRHQYIVSYVSAPAAHAGFKPLKVEVRGRDRALEAPRSVFLEETPPASVRPAPKKADDDGVAPKTGDANPNPQD
jgi:hypothetical protein